MDPVVGPEIGGILERHKIVRIRPVRGILQRIDILDLDRAGAGAVTFPEFTPMDSVVVDKEESIADRRQQSGYGRIIGAGGPGCDLTDHHGAGRRAVALPELVDVPLGISGIKVKLTPHNSDLLGTKILSHRHGARIGAVALPEPGTRVLFVLEGVEVQRAPKVRKRVRVFTAQAGIVAHEAHRTCLQFRHSSREFRPRRRSSPRSSMCCLSGSSLDW